MDRAALELVGVTFRDDAGENVRSQIEGLRRELSSAFQEREREIEGLIVAVLAREHVLLLGPPGTAKSAIARAFCASISGAEYFERLLTRFSVPEELYGPISMAGLREDRYQRVSTGAIQVAHVAFLDEIFKANSAILNSLLTLINERKFHDGSGVRDAPLLAAIAASNELPEGDELGALYDRFVLRFFVSYTASEAAFEGVLFGADPRSRVTTRIPLASWREAQADVAHMPVDQGLGATLFALRAEMAAMGITVSDRRWRKAVGIMRAAAWLDGCDVVTAEYLTALGPVLWHTPDQIPRVASVLARHASPHLAAATEIHDAAMDLVARVSDEKAPGFFDAVKATYAELKKAIDKIAEAEARSQAPSAKRRIGGLRLQVTSAASRLRSMGRRAASFE